MQGVMRAICIAYLVFLSLLLLSEKPERVIWLDQLPWILQALLPYAHVLSFALLAVLAMGVRWPMPRWAIVLMMAAYGGLTEILQRFTHRHPAWLDWFRDVSGIAVGTALCWIAAVLASRFAGRRRGRDAGSRTDPSEEWNVMQEALSRPAAAEQSWWR
jgi:hypothetical protein